MDPQILRFLSAAPERLRQIVAEKPEQKVVMIDEVQKVPELLNVIHALIEEKQGYCFIMTGSSSLLIYVKACCRLC